MGQSKLMAGTQGGMLDLCRRKKEKKQYLEGVLGKWDGTHKYRSSCYWTLEGKHSLCKDKGKDDDI